MESIYRSTARATTWTYTRKLTQDERLMVACVVVALLAFLAICWTGCVQPAGDAGALAGV